MGIRQQRSYLQRRRDLKRQRRHIEHQIKHEQRTLRLRLKRAERLKAEKFPAEEIHRQDLLVKQSLRKLGSLGFELDRLKNEILRLKPRDSP